MCVEKTLYYFNLCLKAAKDINYSKLFLISSIYAYIKPTHGFERLLFKSENSFNEKLSPSISACKIFMNQCEMNEARFSNIWLNFVLTCSTLSNDPMQKVNETLGIQNSVFIAQLSRESENTQVFC